MNNTGAKLCVGICCLWGVFSHANDEIAAAIELLESKGYRVLAPDPAGAETLPELSISEIEREIDLWPVEVELKTTINFVGGRQAREGSMLQLQSIENGSLSVVLDDLLFTVMPEDTDLIARAQRIAADTGNYPGRLALLLASQAEVHDGSRLQRATVEGLARSDVYVLYFGSPQCGWCSRFLPTLQQAIDEQRTKGDNRVRFIYAAMSQMSSNDYRSYMSTLDADAGLPPGNRFFVDSLMAEMNVKRIALPQPSLMLMNASGEVLAFASREDRDLSRLNALLDKDLVGFLDNPESIRPQWMTR